MHIHSLTVSGFKSFAQTSTLNFHEHINVVVGPNGSGKSNIFNAIAFVLQPTSLTKAQWLSLFHQNDHPNSYSAFVEIRLDNRDNRIPDKDPASMVEIRRTIGLKQDTILVNKKPFKRSSLLSLLGAAGFSRGNPYYIVHQGEIQRMALCTPETRLSLVKDMAGIEDFEARRTGAVKKLEKWRLEQVEVQTRLTEVEEELERLKDEGQHLKRFVALDKQKQALDQTYNMICAQEAHRKLEEIPERKAELARKKMEAVHVLEGVQGDCLQAQTFLKKADEEISAKTHSRDMLRSEVGELIEEEARLSARIRSGFDEICEQESLEATNHTEVVALRKLIADKESVLEAKARELAQAREAGEAKELELAKLRQVQKLHHSSRVWDADTFRSDEERHECLNHELTVLEENLHERNQDVVSMRQVQADLHRERMKLREDLSQTRLAIDEHRARIQEENAKAAQGAQESAQLRLEAEEMVQKLRQMLEKKNTYDVNLREAKLECVMGKPMLKGALTGYESLLKVLDSFQSEGNQAVVSSFKGIVGQLIELPDARCDVALSVALGASIFNPVVSTARNATLILKRKSKLQLPGEIKVVALDKISPFEPQPMQPPVAKSKPLIDVVRFSQEMTPLAKFYLARFMLVRDASQFDEFRGSSYDCVTLTGDEMWRRGVLRGGYYKASTSVLSLFRKYIECRRKVEDWTAQEREIHSHLEHVNRKVMVALDGRERSLTKAKILDDKNQSLKLTEGCLETRLNDLAQEVETVSESAHRQELDRTEIESSKQLLQSILQPVQPEDSGYVTRGAEVLQNDLRLHELTSEYKALFARRNELENQRNRLKNELDNCLRAKLRDLLQELSPSKSSLQARNEALLQESNLKLASTRLQSARDLLEKVESRLGQVSAKKYEIQERVDQEQSALGEAQTNVKQLTEEYALCVERESNLRLTAGQSKEKAGTLDEQYRDYDLKRILKESKRLQKELDKYPNVNQQADDEYIRLEEKKKKVENLWQHSTEHHQRITRLLEDIEVHKKNKVHFTINQISKNFSQIFGELVHEGRGKMKFLLHKGNPDEPLGIALMVSFASSGDYINLNHLSGGQKSIVAIAFIFAIQKCDPVPFYILDEVDAALDPTHRQRVIQWMAKQQMQFICTTFRSEFLAQADHVIGVRHNGVSSHAQVVDAQDATDFIQEDNH